MARDGEQQAMTSERLAEIAQFVFDLSMIGELGEHNVEHDYLRDLLAEVERLRGVLNERASLPRDKREQRDRREATLLEIARAVANGGNAEDFRQRSAYLLNYHVYASEVMREKARALLASAGEQTAQGETGAQV